MMTCCQKHGRDADPDAVRVRSFRETPESIPVIFISGLNMTDGTHKVRHGFFNEVRKIATALRDRLSV